MKAKMTALEARKAELVGKFAQLDEDEAPLRLHPGLADVYRRKVTELAAALNVEGSRSGAVEVLLCLASEIRLTPSPEGHEIERLRVHRRRRGDADPASTDRLDR